ncbi:sortase [Bifidobacterium sp. DSM 109957]|uniref:Sortase n=1 Tax=Bifidobacterium oedipodis TaxID=2675322 RepID=A0A7Y0HT24_9BIFI|nr:sortase [Bifidobacterium sp. DSM 109957]
MFRKSADDVHINLTKDNGTDDAVLQIAVGHLPGSSLPVGGVGTHAVVSGHTGLPSARLLTGLDELAEGDTFAFHVLDGTYTYEVDRISVVLPDELDDLDIVPDRDYATLVTCTPYGVNSHRLLVRGHRIPNPSTADDTDYEGSGRVWWGVLVGVVVLVVGVAGVLVWRCVGSSRPVEGAAHAGRMV